MKDVLTRIIRLVNSYKIHYPIGRYIIYIRTSNMASHFSKYNCKYIEK